MTDLNALFARFVEVVQDVPFGNSDWQNRNVIVNDELTPARAYRHAALRIVNRIHALRETYYGLSEKQIELRELRERLARPWWHRRAVRSVYERERLALKIERLDGDLPYTRKLIADAVREIESLMPVIAAQGALTRDQFEQQESLHFEKKLQKQLPPASGDLYQAILDQRSNSDPGLRLHLDSLCALLLEKPQTR